MNRAGRGLAPVTVAVKVTDWPTVDGFKDEVSVVTVVTGVIDSLSDADVLVAFVLSPLYTAEIVCVPTESAEVVNAATP